MPHRPPRCTRHRPGLLVLCAALLLPLAAGDEAESPELPAPPAVDLAQHEPYPVRDVPDGHTFTIPLGGKDTTVRLIGVYVPQLPPARAEAHRFLTRLLAGESVHIVYEPDWPMYDRDDRVWAYVYRAPDGLFVNLELIRQGYARMSGAGPFEHRRLLRAYELHAQRHQKGVWHPRMARETPHAATSQPQPRDAAASQPATPRPAENADAAGTTVVYVTQHGRKYHRADCHYVAKGGIRMTLAEAQAKGYAPCSRCKPPE